MREPRRQVIKKIDGKPVLRRSPSEVSVPPSGYPANPTPQATTNQPLLAASLEQAQRTLEMREGRVRELETKTAEQATEIATLRLELATARDATSQQDPLLTERLHDLEKQVEEYQKVLAQRTAECQTLQARVQELEATRKSQQIQAGIDVGGSLRDM